MTHFMNTSPTMLRCLVLLSMIAGTVGVAQDTPTRIRALAQPLIDADRTIGLSIGAIADGQTHSVHLGKTGKDQSTADDQTVYEIGSISKVFTGVMLADAVRRSVVKLDQPAGELLPENVVMPSHQGDPITLLDLATHRSGLPRLPSNLTELFESNPYAKYTSTRAYEFLNAHPLRRAPGEAYEYSNFGTSLLGHLLCVESGKDYDELLRQTITGPLKMNSTGVELTEAMTSVLATPHAASKLPTNTWEFADMPGAGGIRSTTADMLRFAAANLDPPDNEPDNEIGESLELAWKQHQTGDSSSLAMGLGWHIARDGKTRWHNGATGGYRSMLMINRDLRIAVVVLGNTACPDIDALAERIIQSLATAGSFGGAEPLESAKDDEQ